MEWIADPGVGAWLRATLDDGLDSMHAVVPRGFPAYARIFHPAAVRESPTAAGADVRVRWAQTAAAFGTTMHAEAQWHRIVRTPADGDWRSRIAPDGREVTAPLEGALDSDLVAILAEHLAAHTSTPDDGVVALWDGFGGLVGFFGDGPSRAFLTFSDEPNHQAMLERSIHDPFNNAFRKPTWQDGILSREISEGPRLHLPGRDYVLFSGGARDFVDPEWILSVPWRDRVGEEHGFPPAAQSPNILWPADRAWVMVSEVDYDSTIVAGSPDLIRAICTDDRLEALALRAGADLTWDADEVNR